MGRVAVPHHEQNGKDEHVSDEPRAVHKHHDATALLDPQEPAAWVGGWLGTDLVQVSNDPAVLDTTGRWAVTIDFEGGFKAARFATWRDCAASELPVQWRGLQSGWVSSMTASDYLEAVAAVRAHIAAGSVYQVNLCRVLSADLPDSGHPVDPLALGRRLALGNPAPYAAALRIPSADVFLASASPELFLSRDGSHVASRPIKGTAPTAGNFLEKDVAENIMIVDLVRNDFGIVAEPGSVQVPEFLVTEEHPGLAHLVSTVSAHLRPEVTWTDLLAATFPPGSVSGAPKLSALSIIGELEPTIRGPYCGAFGWVDADAQRAELAVAIRTFWFSDVSQGAGQLSFGTGAGITWGSDAALEWQETELKAARLIRLASERHW